MLCTAPLTRDAFMSKSDHKTHRFTVLLLAQHPALPVVTHHEAVHDDHAPAAPDALFPLPPDILFLFGLFRTFRVAVGEAAAAAVGADDKDDVVSQMYEIGTRSSTT